jgi:alpha-L-fucosidase 2
LLFPKEYRLEIMVQSAIRINWENALPIGNGRLGAMIYGNVEKEIIQLNEHTVWSGSPNRNDNSLSLDSLNVIRQLIFEGKQKEAERIVNRVIITKKSHGQNLNRWEACSLHLKDMIIFLIITGNWILKER